MHELLHRGGSEMFTARQARIATIECRKKPGIALHESGKFLKNCGAVSVGEYCRIIEYHQMSW